MRYLAFLIYVTVLVIMASSIGCGTDNPICTDSFCLVPRDQVTGEVTELDNAKVLALIDSLAVDTPEAVDTGTLAEIVSDTAAGGTAYNGRFVSVTGEVKANLTLTGTSEGLTLQSGNESVTFFVIAWGNRDNLTQYQVGETYDFSLFIAESTPALTTGADVSVVESDEKYSVFGHLAHGISPQVVSTETLLADARSGNQRYQGRVVRVTDQVSLTTSGSIFFATIGFFLSKSGHPDEAEMTPGQTVTVDAFIVAIGKNRFTSLLQIRAYLIRD